MMALPHARRVLRWHPNGADLRQRILRARAPIVNRAATRLVELWSAAHLDLGKYARTIGWTRSAFGHPRLTEEGLSRSVIAPISAIA
jgi:hypothetical protein